MVEAAADAVDGDYSVSAAQREPIIRVLQNLLSIISRNTWNRTLPAATAAAASAPVFERQLEPTTFLMLFPVMRHVLALPYVLPGAEHTLHILDR